ncbi:ParA family protein [Kocuria coralli]|uniref:ParA family protein n=1 Tax=Kocuria coralli TaxID=1461025 RepID=A0A5J5L0I9_9MICC|nr:ParA family protein [Kocuria coralli]KAA9394441.1 ParA family protein [Kocuria coralli]
MQIVSVSSLKGGVGKSSVTLGLASAALADGVPTLVVDLDPHADATTGLGVHATSELNVGRVLARRSKPGAIRAVAVSSPWVTRETGDGGKRRLDVAPGSSASSPLDRSTYRAADLSRLVRALEGMAADYELVLIDCPPNLNALTRMAWAASTKVLSVAEPSLFSVAGTQRTMTAIAHFERDSPRAVGSAGVVVNRVHPDAREHRFRVDELNELFGPLLVAPVIPENQVWQRAQGSAWPIHRWPGADAEDLADRYTQILRGLLATGAPAEEHASAGE